MNAVIHKRRSQLAQLIRYLYGPGRNEEHTNPHLVSAWADAGDLATLEPPTGRGGARDVRRLVELLEQPVTAGRNPPRLTVWHCSVRTAPEDRLLSDQIWAHVAGEVMAGVGLAPHGDLAAVRWIAVRHASDHIHLVATLVRQDGRTAWAWHDRTKSRAVCAQLEERYGLRRVGPADRTSHRHPGAAEVNKAKRLGRAMPARDELRRQVRAAAVAASVEEEFFARLADAGILVKFRHSSRDPDQRTGYAVALPADTTAAGTPVWFSGGKLAPDLTLPKLRQRWTHPGDPAGAGGPVRVSPAARAQAMTAAAEAIGAAAEAMAHLAQTNPAAAYAVAQAASDTLTALARSVEGRRGGPITTAAELFDKASRGTSGRVAKATGRSYQLRAMSRLVALMGRVSGDAETYAVLMLLHNLARLADHVAALAQAQQRLHQAEAAARAATVLRHAAASGGRITPGGPVQAPDLTTAADLGNAAGDAAGRQPAAPTPEGSRPHRPHR